MNEHNKPFDDKDARDGARAGRFSPIAAVIIMRSSSYFTWCRHDHTFCSSQPTSTLECVLKVCKVASGLHSRNLTRSFLRFGTMSTNPTVCEPIQRARARHCLADSMLAGATGARNVLAQASFGACVGDGGCAITKCSVAKGTIQSLFQASDKFHRACRHQIRLGSLTRSPTPTAQAAYVDVVELQIILSHVLARCQPTDQAIK